MSRGHENVLECDFDFYLKVWTYYKMQTFIYSYNDKGESFCILIYHSYQT